MAELIVALDVKTRAHALQTVQQLGESVSFYKIGMELFTAEGPDVVKAVKDLGKHIFLDLKFHDIPRTVEHAVMSAGRLGVDLLTIHASGGPAMIAAAHEGAAACEKPPRILAVTVLTSLDGTDLQAVGVHTQDVGEQVVRLARLAIENHADGLVCSPLEVGKLSTTLPHGTLFVTPGVRPLGGTVGDQKRVTTPAQAVQQGATHLVVGRPILCAPDPVAAAQAIQAEIRQVNNGH